MVLVIVSYSVQTYQLSEKTVLGVSALTLYAESSFNII